MIKIENVETLGWEAAIRGMRNPKNSWDKSDSYWTHIENPQTENTAKFQFFIGDNDLKLARALANAGNDHGKFMRMIVVTADITSPLYWWKEYDTYKVGTVANSCSTMHKIADKEFTLADFSHEHLQSDSLSVLEEVIHCLNTHREWFLAAAADDPKVDWWQMIQLLPTSYNQRRTVQLNYAALKNMYHARKVHKLDEWHDFCSWIESLPYAELITGKSEASA